MTLAWAEKPDWGGLRNEWELWKWKSWVGSSQLGLGLTKASGKGLDGGCRVKLRYRENRSRHFPCYLLSLFTLLNLKSHLKKILIHFNFSPNSHCFLNRKTLTPSAYHWHPERKCSSFFSFQIIKNKSVTSGKFLSLSVCRNRLWFCTRAPC